MTVGTGLGLFFALRGEPGVITTGQVSAAGGVVEGTEGARLIIPAGSIAADTTVTITEGGSAPAFSLGGAQPAGQLVSFEINTDLTGMVTVEIPFDQASVPGTPGTAEVFAAVWAEELGGWIPVEGETDWAAGVVRVTTDHLSDWRSFLWDLAWDHLVPPAGGDLPAQPTTAERSSQYVALGDSFSAGFGVSDQYEVDAAGTAPECHRSTKAYPNEVANGLGLSGSWISRACTGAKVAWVGESGPWESAQIGWLSDETRVVTITIGGNNLGDVLGDGQGGIAAVIAHCATHDCAGDDQEARDFRSDIDTRIFELEVDLTDLFGKIRDEARNAAVYVLAYPHVFAYRGACGPLFSNNEINWWNERTDALNAMIERAADATGVGYIATREAFLDRTLCGMTNPRYITAASLFHPNEDGQAALADLVSERLAADGFSVAVPDELPPEESTMSPTTVPGSSLAEEIGMVLWGQMQQELEAAWSQDPAAAALMEQYWEPTSFYCYGEVLVNVFGVQGLAAMGVRPGAVDAASMQALDLQIPSAAASLSPSQRSYLLQGTFDCLEMESLLTDLFTELFGDRGVAECAVDAMFHSEFWESAAFLTESYDPFSFDPLAEAASAEVLACLGG